MKAALPLYVTRFSAWPPPRTPAGEAGLPRPLPIGGDLSGAGGEDGGVGRGAVAPAPQGGYSGGAGGEDGGVGRGAVVPAPLIGAKAPSGWWPELEFVEPLFRRRLSLVSRMTIQVLHELLPLGEDTKIRFLSFRGEITQQLRINQTLVREHTVRPAAFSLSVFNTPVALATIALDLRAGYSALYPSGGRFDLGLWAAAAPVAAGEAEQIALVYADEPAPEAYGPLRPRENNALALGAILSARNSVGALPLEKVIGGKSAGTSPVHFLRSLLAEGVPYGSP